MNHPLYDLAAIRQTERAATAALGDGVLMRRAGLAAARLAIEMIGTRRDAPVLLCAGPGNNGGDALETAANLHEAGVPVRVLHLPGAVAPSSETAQALARARAGGVPFLDALPAGLAPALVVDGLFGIGLARPLAGPYAALVQAMDRLGCPVLALDVPSGLDADTGAVVGGGCAVRADATLTFIGDKPGLHTCDGRDHAGQVRVESLGIAAEHVAPPIAALSDTALFADALRASRRRHNSHKGSFGDVAILGGAPGMAGAPILAARGALYAGAGRVFVAALDLAVGYDSLHPELMLRPAAGFDFGGRTVVAGPGMGDAPAAAQLLARAIDGDSPLVVDADALNRLAADPALQTRLAQRAAPTVLTPHPLEAARLLGVTATVVQADRIEAARELSLRLHAAIILKGSGSIIADAGGAAIAINPTGNPGLATAGTGDVLSGVCGALLAQGWTAWHAALGGAWLHGAAADDLVREGVGPIGMTAGELPAALRRVLNRLVAGASR